MLKRIEVQRFRGFKQLIIDVPKVLTLMGPNSSGKTTALHAIRVACQSVWLGMENAEKISFTDNLFKVDDLVVRDISQLMPIADWQALFVDQKVSETIHFSINLEFDINDPISEIEVQGRYARNDNLKIVAKVEAKELAILLDGVSSRTALYKKQINEYFVKHLPKAILIPPFYGVIRSEEYRAKAVVDAMIGSADQSHVVRNMIARLTPQQFVQLNAFLKDMVNAELVQRPQGDELESVPTIRVTFKDSNGDLELSAAGAGLINLVAIYSSLARWQSESSERQIIFLLDEPEAHLHPQLQSLTADRLATIITETFNAQLIMATHSIDIINALGKRTDAAVFRTDRLNKETGGQELSGQDALLDDLSRWADMTPFSALNFLASKRIFFHESKSDSAIIKKCADILFRNNPAKKGAFEKWTFLPLDGCENRAMASMLAKLLQSNLIAGNLDLNQFKIFIQLDKDYSDAQPGLAQLADVNIPAFTNYWSLHSIESLFCESAILYQWLKTEYLNLEENKIVDAICKANSAEDLNQYAREKRQDTLLKQLPKTSENITVTNRQAQADISNHPSMYQRGKDRAQFILSLIKKDLGLEAKNLTTDLSKFINRKQIDSLPAGNPDIVPKEIKGLLEWMVKNA